MITFRANFWFLVGSGGAGGSRGAAGGGGSLEGGLAPGLHFLLQTYLINSDHHSFLSEWVVKDTIGKIIFIYCLC